MKTLSEYINEKTVVPTVESADDVVWIIKDKDLDGAIMDVCATEEDANKAYDEHMKENDHSRLEITTCKRSEVEKK